MNILRFLLFDNSCVLCRKTLSIFENKLCVNCCEELERVSIKQQNNIIYLWKINRFNYNLYKLYINGRGSAFKELNRIILSKKKLLNPQDYIFFKPFLFTQRDRNW